jgi:hypothetical protein
MGLALVAVSTMTTTTTTKQLPESRPLLMLPTRELLW